MTILPGFTLRNQIGCHNYEELPRLHWDVEARCFRALLRIFVAGIGVAENSHGRVIGEDAIKSLCGFGCSIGNDDLASVL